MRPRCACGCGQRGVHRHHCVYEQHLRAQHRRDERNLIWLAGPCHAAHHARQAPLGLLALPDSVFEFAREVLGPGPAYVYLRRRYAGEDDRLEALIA